MAETKTEKIEREYIIPLMSKWAKVPIYKRANKAVKAVREFIAKHMKIYDRDLRKIKIDKFLNEELWFRGIKKPPHKIKVKAIKEGDIVRVELSDYKEKLKFKKAREERKEKEAVEKKKPKKEETPETKEEENKAETEEKKAATIESMEKLEKTAAKQAKHQTKQSKQPKHQVRQALKK